MIVKTMEKYGIINTNGKIILPIKYMKSEVEFYSGGRELLKTLLEPERKGVFNETGREIMRCIYEEAFVFSKDWIGVKKSGKWGFFSEIGEEIVPCIYEDARGYLKDFIGVKKSEKWGFIDKTGKEISLFDYDDVDYLYIEDCVGIKKSGKWGLYDNSGKEIVPCIYEDVYFFSKDKHAVSFFIL